MNLKIALDAFGGDFAPQATIDGAILAVNEAPELGFEGISVTLVGNRKSLESFYQTELPAGVNVLDTAIDAGNTGTDPHADGDDPNSPIRIALRLHRSGKFDGVVSAGATGSQLIASLNELEKIPGITRPAVGSFLPTVTGTCFLLDVGASLVASPHHLVQFATMGHVYVRELLGIEEPRIGVLNVGRESAVGERNAVEAYNLLSHSGFNFTGFVEGSDLPDGVADVVVTNGFVGNILLKYTEGFPVLIRRHIQDGGSSEFVRAIEEQFDYQHFGGEPLLGVKGVSIICHGASSPQAVAAGIVKAARIARMKLYEKLETFLVSKFDSYLSQVKYLRSFRRTFRLPGRFHFGESGEKKV